MARYVRSWLQISQMRNCMPVPDPHTLGMVRDWLNDPSLKGRWGLTFNYEMGKNCVYFTDKDTAFACKMRWG